MSTRLTCSKTILLLVALCAVPCDTSLGGDASWPSGRPELVARADLETGAVSQAVLCAYVMGRLTDCAGQPLPNAEIRAVGYPPMPGMVDADGRFFICVNPNSEIEIYGEISGMAGEPVRVTSPGLGLFVDVGDVRGCPQTVIAPDEFGVADTGYGTGGTAGNYTIEINGALFDRSVTATLADGAGFERQASAYYRSDAQTLYATFDLTQVAPGTYDVVIAKPTIGERTTVVKGLTVVAGGGGTNKPELANEPASISRRANQVYSFEVHWRNTGINDALSPLLVVHANEPFSDDPNDLRDGRGRYSLTFYGVPSGNGPPGLLRPGQSVARTFYINPQPLPDGAWRHVAYSVNRPYKNPQAPFDWESIRDDIQPLDMADETFESLFQQLNVQVGRTCGDFLEMLSRNASLLGRREDGAVRWEDCVSLELAFSQASLETSISGRIENPDFALEIGNVDITALNTGTGMAYTTATLSDGSFVLSVEAGEYVFSCSDAAIAQEGPLVVNSGGTSTIELPVTLGGRLRGTVFLEGGGLATDIDVLVAERAAAGLTYRRARTDEMGAYRLSHLPEGDYAVSIRPGELGWSPPQAVAVSDGSVMEVDMHLRPTELLDIRVVRHAGDEPVENAWVALASSATEIQLAGYTDSQGKLQLHLPAGHYTYEVTAEDLVPAARTLDVLDSAQNAVTVSLDAYGSLTGTIADDLTGLIDDIIAVEMQGGGYYVAELDSPAYEFDAVVPGTYAVLAIGQDDILSRLEVDVYAGQVTQAPIVDHQGLQSNLQGAAARARAALRLAGQDSAPEDISLWEAIRLLRSIDQVIARAQNAIGDVETLGDPPSSPFGYPALELWPSSDLEQRFLSLCSDRERHVQDLLDLHRKNYELTGPMISDIGILLAYQQGSLIVQILEWLERLASMFPDYTDTPLGKAIQKLLPKLFKLADALRAIGAVSRVHATTFQLEENNRQYNEITQSYNRALAAYESQARREGREMDRTARNAIEQTLAYGPVGGYSFTATVPGPMQDETKIPLGDVGVLMVDQGGGWTFYPLWEIDITVDYGIDGQYVEHWIDVYDSGECAEVSHRYRLRADEVTKEFLLCDGSHKWEEVSFTGPERVIPVSIQLCMDGPGGGGGIPGDDDPDDVGGSPDDSEPEDCPGGRMRDPATGECTNECKPGWILNPFTNECERPCPEGMRQDPGTGECLNPCAQFAGSDCEPGLVPNPQGAGCMTCDQARNSFCVTFAEYTRVGLEYEMMRMMYEQVPGYVSLGDLLAMEEEVSRLRAELMRIYDAMYCGGCYDDYVLGAMEVMNVCAQMLDE